MAGVEPAVVGVAEAVEGADVDHGSDLGCCAGTSSVSDVTAAALQKAKVAGEKGILPMTVLTCDNDDRQAGRGASQCSTILSGDVRCAGAQFERSHEIARMSACRRHFDVVDGIPDFRLAMPSWIDVVEDTNTARELSRANLPLNELVRAVYSRRVDDVAWVDRRTRQVLEGSERLRDDVRSWLAPVIAGGPFLDLGCGGGMLMAAAADVHPGLQTVGIDVSMVWLVVAKRLVAEQGGRPIWRRPWRRPFLLRMRASLPRFADVIEHVADPAIYLQEVNRVVEVGVGWRCPLPIASALRPSRMCPSGASVGCRSAFNAITCAGGAANHTNPPC